MKPIDINTYLWPHQQDIIKNVYALRKEGFTAPMIQSATGSGKTRVAVWLIRTMFLQKTLPGNEPSNIYFLAPRIELIDSISEELVKMGIPHTKMTDGNPPRMSSRVHVSTNQTFSIYMKENALPFDPNRIIIDEAHTWEDWQSELKKAYPDALFYGLSATPKDQRDVYDCITLGESIPALTAKGCLSNIRYFVPPESKAGNIYGDAYNLLLKHSNPRKGKLINPFISFHPSIKEAVNASKEFQAKGLNVKVIHGKMKGQQVKKILNEMRNLELDGLTNCDIATYGIDIPAIEIVIFMRHTKSFELYMQMIGRGTRSYHESHTGYTKPFCTILDMVNNLEYHALSENTDGQPIPPHWEPEIDWGFLSGKERKKKKRKVLELDIYYCRPCGYSGYDRYCPDCKKDLMVAKQESEVNHRKKLKEIKDAELQEIKQGLIANRPYEEKKEAFDRIRNAQLEWEHVRNTGQIHEKASQSVKDILALNKQAGYKGYLFAYYKIANKKEIQIEGEKMPFIDNTLLHEIRRILGFKAGWVHHQKQAISEKYYKQNA